MKENVLCIFLQVFCSTKFIKLDIAEAIEQGKRQEAQGGRGDCGAEAAWNKRLCQKRRRKRI